MPLFTGKKLEGQREEVRKIPHPFRITAVTIAAISGGPGSGSHFTSAASMLFPIVILPQ